MTVIRAFIAVDLPVKILDQLGKISQSLKRDIPTGGIRWVPVKNIHLTLMFLGDVTLSNLDPISKTLDAELASFNQVKIQLEGLGAFPSVKKPRVLWIGIAYPPELKTIYNSIQQNIGALGYPRDERAFSPHLTLGRVSQNITSADLFQISQVIESHPIGSLGSALIDSIHLYQSDLRPGGAVYTKLYSVNLGELTTFIS
jgi:RNA 2',3'-cyclic 3'-phosphodiesterase